MGKISCLTVYKRRVCESLPAKQARRTNVLEGEEIRTMHIHAHMQDFVDVITINTGLGAVMATLITRKGAPVSPKQLELPPQ